MAEVTFPGDVSIPCDADMMDFQLTGLVEMPENACTYLVDTIYSSELGEIHPYQFGRKWVCIDYCGHVEEHTQLINLIDAFRPELSVHDLAISFAHGSTITIKPEDVVTSVTDNCDSEVSLTLSQEIFTCEFL
jgi:hypothetical protein